MIKLEPPGPLFPTRFAASALWETVSAVRCVLYPAKHPIHTRWASRQPSVEELDLGLMPVLLPASGWAPDFVTPPPPPDHEPDIDRELRLLEDTDLATVRGELGRLQVTTGHPALSEAIQHPAAFISELSDTLRRCFATLVAPVWPRALELLTNDVEFRAELMVKGGLPAVLEDLKPEVTHTPTHIQVRSSDTIRRVLDERGLLLMPTLFSWPTVTVYAEGGWQPTLIYRARAAGELWLSRWSPGDALGSLLGRRRAMILDLVHDPRSTTAVASALSISPATASEHLQVLFAAGLVRRRRAGREQLYSQTELGRQLISRNLR